MLRTTVNPITVTLCHIQTISKFSIRIRLTGPLKETNEPYEMATLKYILNCFFFTVIALRCTLVSKEFTSESFCDSLGFINILGLRIGMQSKEDWGNRYF